MKSEENIQSAIINLKQGKQAQLTRFDPATKIQFAHPEEITHPAATLGHEQVPFTRLNDETQLQSTQEPFRGGYLGNTMHSSS